jgi:predicted nucleic-acid-binding Zn-ribbon protein
MSGELFVFSIVVLVFIAVYLNKLYETAKTKAIETVEKELKINDKIAEAELILKKNTCFNNFAFNKAILDNAIIAYDQTIGHCPKCKVGRLEISKILTGMDKVYERYPTYVKFIKCNMCSYTESYNKLKKRKNDAKFEVSIQMLNDINRAYKIK